VYGKQLVDVRRWLFAARHPARRDGVIAAALLVLPWPLVWTLAPHHHLDSAAVTILLTLTIPLAGFWLTWAGFRDASRSTTADGGTGPRGITTGPDSVVADRGGIAVGYGGTAVVFRQRRGVIGKPVQLDYPPQQLVGRDDLLAELDARLTTGDNPAPTTAVFERLGRGGEN